MARVVVLAGGSGGAKLARGMLDAAGEELAVVANTGDDVQIYGAHVSPDPDLVTWWLADRIDERGWGVGGDSFTVMEELGRLGVDTWFSLGDRDLAACLRRRALLDEGLRLTEAHARLVEALGVSAQVLPMCDEVVRTWVLREGGWHPFQEFMVRLGGTGPVEGVDYRGARQAHPTPEVRDALAGAEAIVIGPSNPVISINPILAVAGMREALRGAPAPVVAVSPIVGGSVVKGPTEPFMQWAGFELSAAGVASYYGDVLDGVVADEPVEGLPALRTDTLMGDAQGRARVARETLDFARALREG